MFIYKTTRQINDEPWPLPNVWLGVSAENQRFLDARLLHLCEVPAAVRFVSAEPLLGPLDFRGMWKPQGVDWVIVGGESGPGARMCSQEWIRGIVQQCRAAHVPVFVKQIGSMSAWRERGVNGGFRPKDRKGGDPAEWPADLRIRQFPTTGGPA